MEFSFSIFWCNSLLHDWAPNIQIVSNNELNWFSAEEMCQLHCGSHLASIHSKTDSLTIFTALLRKFKSKYYVASIGLSTSRIAQTNETSYWDWQWSDGTALDFGNVSELVHASSEDDNFVAITFESVASWGHSVVVVIVAVVERICHFTKRLIVRLESAFWNIQISARGQPDNRWRSHYDRIRFWRLTCGAIHTSHSTKRTRWR